MPNEFEGQRVTVMGLGRFGGGVGVTRFLAGRGADVLVTDQSPQDKLVESVAKLQPLIDTGQVTLRLGGHNVSDFTTCDLVVVNPAVPPGPPENRFVRAAQAAGIPVTTEIRLLVERLPNRLRTIGVTGSAGKSTVTAMIGHVLGKVFAGEGGAFEDATPSRQDAKTPRKAGEVRKVWVGGNIGGSLLERVDEIGSDDWVVLELSSFMLERLRDQPDAPGFADGKFRGWSPHIAVVTNISENHLDWHGSMAEYVEAKRTIYRYQFAADYLLAGFTPHQSVAFGGFVLTEDRPKACFSAVDPLCPIELALPGKHNLTNASLALGAIKFATIDGADCLECIEYQTLRECIADFAGLPHRLEFVGEYDGVKYYNDSKCTTPAAARLAVEAFSEKVSDTISQEMVSDTFYGRRGEKGVGSRFLDGDGGPPSELQENDSRPLLGPGVHLILGGYDKGSDLAPLAGFARGACKAVYTIGDTGEAIATAAEAASAGAERAGELPGAEVVRCETLERAVDEIRGRVLPGDVVLLSPGCASWDQFENYEQRGARFIELVRGA